MDGVTACFRLGGRRVSPWEHTATDAGGGYTQWGSDHNHPMWRKHRRPALKPRTRDVNWLPGRRPRRGGMTVYFRPRGSTFFSTWNEDDDARSSQLPARAWWMVTTLL